MSLGWVSVVSKQDETQSTGRQDNPSSCEHGATGVSDDVTEIPRSTCTIRRLPLAHTHDPVSPMMWSGRIAQLLSVSTWTSRTIAGGLFSVAKPKTRDIRPCHIPTESNVLKPALVSSRYPRRSAPGLATWAINLAFSSRPCTVGDRLDTRHAAWHRCSMDATLETRPRILVDGLGIQHSALPPVRRTKRSKVGLATRTMNETFRRSYLFTTAKRTHNGLVPSTAGHPFG